ncbi:cytochrome b/b6 domain-containing protein [Thiolapillus sp.]
MSGPEIRRLPVWGKALRLSHWSLALATLVLLCTGGLIRWAPERAQALDEIHFISAAVLIAALVARLWLLFAGTRTERLGALLPNRHRLTQAWGTLRSYMTLGKIRLPRWYAHNPLWAMLYLLLFLVLCIQILTGLLLLNHITLLGDLSLRQLHLLGYVVILGFVILHVLASFFHDTQGDGSDISAMISGQRIFIVEEAAKPPPANDNVVVTLDPAKFRKPEKP